MLGIIQPCGECSLRFVVWSHNVQELYPWSSLGRCQISIPSYPAATLHLMPVVQPAVFPDGLQGQHQVPTQELLSALDG
jgi:hypothetical protein